MVSCGDKLRLVASDKRTDEPAEDREAWADAVKDRLQKILERKGLSQRQLGEQLGITGSAVSQRIGREGSMREWWQLFRFAKAVGVSADELLGLTPPTQASQAVSPQVIRRLLQKLEDVATEAERVAAILPPDADPETQSGE